MMVRKRTILLSCILALSVAAPVLANPHRAGVEQWRSDREERLSQPDGWLTLVGLDWLDDGENRVGSGADNDIVLPGGPDRWGTVFVAEDAVSFEAADPSVTVDGEAPAGRVSLTVDRDGSPTVVGAGPLQFTVIFRESLALRVKDAESPILLGFDGLDYYDIDDRWRINADFQRAPEGSTVEVANVLGQLEPTPVYGTLRFEREGRTHELLMFGDDDDDTVWTIFADRTNGHGSYGAGRFVVSEAMPEDGRLLVDFNKAYNPPCAFTDYSTCPIPPPENRLDLRVDAGEKDFKK